MSPKGTQSRRAGKNKRMGQAYRKTSQNLPFKFQKSAVPRLREPKCFSVFSNHQQLFPPQARVFVPLLPINFWHSQHSAARIPEHETHSSTNHLPGFSAHPSSYQIHKPPSSSIKRYGTINHYPPSPPHLWFYRSPTYLLPSRLSSTLRDLSLFCHSLYWMHFVLLWVQINTRVSRKLSSQGKVKWRGPTKAINVHVTRKSLGWKTTTDWTRRWEVKMNRGSQLCTGMTGMAMSSNTEHTQRYLTWTNGMMRGKDQNCYRLQKKQLF